eukprot:COSAG06_NODE_741_length_12661_cov_24.506607_3_plen_85_part_00
MDSLCKPSSTYEEANHHHEVRKRPFCAIFMLKPEHLPRQARDKQRENSKKGRFLAGEWLPVFTGRNPAHDLPFKRRDVRCRRLE